MVRILAQRTLLMTLLVVCVATTSFAQFTQAPPTSAGAPTPVVPRWVKFSGTLLDVNSNPHTGVANVTFAVYSASTGGTALWNETQNVVLDANGKYTVLLGAGIVDGLPTDLFSSGDARWLGVQAQYPGEGEQPRVLLVSVPYAMKSGDAATLGGHPASDYALAGSGGNNNQTLQGGTYAAIDNGGSPSGTVNYLPKFDSATTIKDSQIYDDGTSVGIGGVPASGFKLDVKGRVQATNLIYTDSFNVVNFTDNEHDCDGAITPGYAVSV